MQGLVTVFGGSGFVGAQVVRALARKGLRVRVAVRNTGRGYKLRMLGDVGQIEIVQADAAKCDEAEFIMLKDGLLVFEGNAAELRAATDPYIRNFLS